MKVGIEQLPAIADASEVFQQQQQRKTFLLQTAVSLQSNLVPHIDGNIQQLADILVLC